VQVLHDTFADDPKINVLAAHVGAGDPRLSRAESVPEYAEANGYTYPIVEDGRAIGTAFEVTSIPYFIVVAPDGTIVAEHRGMLRDDARDRLAEAAREARESR
jgi:hypothetical protein